MKYLVLFAIVAIGTVFSSDPSYAACRGIGTGRFNISSNPDLSVTATTDGSPCRHAFTSLGVTYTDSSVTKSPSHGQLQREGIAVYRYFPAKGYKGPDAYAIKLCGFSMTNAKGCASIAFSTTIQ